MIDLVRFVVGYDPREAIAYHVFCQSILERSSCPVSFLPLAEQSIPNYIEYHKDGSNRFTYTRFLKELVQRHLVELQSSRQPLPHSRVHFIQGRRLPASFPLAGGWARRRTAQGVELAGD